MSPTLVLRVIPPGGIYRPRSPAEGVLRPAPLPWLLTSAVLLSGALLWRGRSDERAVRVTGA
jgi:hypothetical protein